MTHLEHDWDSPLWQGWLKALGERFTVVRYDERGCGMSDREPAQLDMDRWLDDVEAVAQAAGLERFALLGMSQAGAIATAYAALHPDRVSHLILYGAYGRGQLRRGASQQARENIELSQSIIRLGWGRANPAFRHVFTARFLPGGSEAQMAWYDELERLSATPEMAARLSLARADVDVTELAPRVRAPTLVIHVDSDEAVPLSEGRSLASLIPGARFLTLQGRNHILLSDQPAWQGLRSASSWHHPRE
jgi:pimeloyl-ACP methyl ester carboxylesterase